MKSPQPQDDVQGRPKRFETPAKVMPFHRVRNPEAPERWHVFEVKDATPLAKAYERGQLCAGRHTYTAEDRYGAGTIFRGIYDAVNGSDCATSNFHRVSGAATEARASERICVARDLRKKIKDRMALDNFFIIEKFCGEGSHASAAVRARYAGFEKAVYHAICVALDDLLDAVVKLGLGKVSRETE